MLLDVARRCKLSDATGDASEGSCSVAKATRDAKNKEMATICELTAFVLQSEAEVLRKNCTATISGLHLMRLYAILKAFFAATGSFDNLA